MTNINQYKKKTPIILWNHRWEYDKNPNGFFGLLNKLSENGVEFKVVILGENFSESPHEFRESIKKLEEKILHVGYVESFEKYAAWLWKSDILPITNIQDFFGASIMEAVYCGCHPILPYRLTYPELFPTEIFYMDENELYDKTVLALKNIETIRKSNLQKTVFKFDWSKMAPTYDAEMESIVNQNK